MTIENKNVIITPISRSPNSDALPILNHDSDRVHTYTPTSGPAGIYIPAEHILSDDCEAVRIAYYVEGTTQDKRIFIQRADNNLQFDIDKAWPLLPGDYVEGCVKGKRKLLIVKPSSNTGSVTIKVMEC